MARINNFEDLIVWQKAKELTLGIYKALEHCKDYGFRDQIQRAAVSIMNNIAEGMERNTNKEKRNFFYTAKGSAGEVRSMLIVGKELKYFSESDFIRFRTLTIDVAKLLSGFIKVLDVSPYSPAMKGRV